MIHMNISNGNQELDGKKILESVSKRIKKLEKEITFEESTPLLTIELDDINSVPKVIYKGEEVKKKVRVSFDWETNSAYYNPTHIHIEHAEVEDDSVCIKSITHNPYM